jgi:hypothetical protein
MNSSLGMKVLVGVLLLAVVVLSWNLYKVKNVSQVPRQFQGVLTSNPPGTQIPIKLSISDAQESTTSPNRETYTVDPSIEYKEINYSFEGAAVQGQVLLRGTLQKSN